MKKPNSPRKPPKSVDDSSKNGNGNGNATGNGNGNGTPQQSTGSDEPRRVMPNSSMSVKTQIRLLRDWEEMSQKSSKPVQRTSFRKKKEADSMIETDYSADDERAAILRMLRRNRRKPQEEMPEGKYSVNGLSPICLIDGYNVIGHWAKLKKRKLSGQMDSARTLLLEEIVSFAAYRGWECLVVFDAMGSRFDGEMAAIGANPNSTSLSQGVEQDYHGVKVVYTKNGTADDYIEFHTNALCDQGNRQVWAVTSDIVQSRVARANGAHVISSSMLVQEIKQSRLETEDILREEANSRFNQKGQKLIDNVSEESRNALYALRDKLNSKPSKQ